MHRLDEFICSGEAIPFGDPLFAEIHKVASRIVVLSVALNNAPDNTTIRELLSEITGQQIDESITVFPPFHINLGIFTRIGKRVFINSGCTFLDIGGITIEDDVLIGPNVKISSEGHPLDPANRKDLMVKPVMRRGLGRFLFTICNFLNREFPFLDILFFKKKNELFSFDTYLI